MQLGGREILMAACQLAGISATGLLVPCYFIDRTFGTDILTTLMQAMLAAFACALILAVWTDREE
ncbi:hypothetical protein SAMN02990966_03338 [Rhodospirillales bacterium URHD0017]|nr:hypothetical protein SAMN02990966_03338 [Rhodospirillales bacterium URHD0017]